MVESFKYAVEGCLLPVISVFGLLGNGLTALVMRYCEVKLKKSLVQLLCGLAGFDNVFLICTFFMFSLPQLSER